jgi:hypothetical protein
MCGACGCLCRASYDYDCCYDYDYDYDYDNDDCCGDNYDFCCEDDNNDDCCGDNYDFCCEDNNNDDCCCDYDFCCEDNDDVCVNDINKLTVSNNDRTVNNGIFCGSLREYRNHGSWFGRFIFRRFIQ